jgi:hypothetical protein
MYFTYLLGWKSYNKFYYGVRYKDNVDELSLGTTYWSSSTYVKDFIVNFGYPDIVEIRKKFDTKEKARNWETKVLRKIRKNNPDMWLNKSNNDSFGGIIMDDDIRAKISSAKKGKSQGILYNNSIEQKYFKSDEEIPTGWIKGRILSQKQKQHIENLNNYNKTKSEEKKKQHFERVSISNKGKPKPSGFGEKVSIATRGKPKPWLLGENNCSKRDDVKLKISQRKKGTKLLGKWYTNNNINLYLKPNDNIPDGFTLGKCLSEKEKLRRKTFQKNKKHCWYNNGVISKMFIADMQPVGWIAGRICKK